MKTRAQMLSATVAAAALFAGASSVRADTVVNKLDLLTATSTGTINDALYAANQTQPAGTGFIDPFVRIQMNGYESGYNTDGEEEFETKDAGGTNWNHSLTVGDLVATTIGGIEYYTFALDINESNSGSPDKHLITMHELELWVHDIGDDGNYANGLGTKVYDMDAGADWLVNLDHDIAEGSGKFDLVVNVKKSLFGNDPNKFVYLYSAFGDPDATPPDEFYDSDAGFEEWTALVGAPPTVIPVPAAVWGGMALFGAIGAGKLIQRRRDNYDI